MLDDRRSALLKPELHDAFRSQLLRATMTIAAIRRQLGDAGEELRAEILDDLKDALIGDEPILVMVEVPGEAEPRLCIRTEGYFRVVLHEFGLDRACERLQETVYEWVRRDIDEVLGAGGS